MRFVPVPVIDEAIDGGFELLRVLEAAVAQNPAMKDGEPDLNLVEPGGVQWCVNEREALAVPGVELAPPAILPVVVNVEVVPDHDDALLWVALREGLHEPHECASVAMRDDLAEHLSCAHIECTEKGARAMTNVLELMADAPIGGHMRRESPGERLHGLFVEAKQDDAVGWSEVELANTASFGSEVWIRAV